MSAESERVRELLAVAREADVRCIELRSPDGFFLKVDLHRSVTAPEDLGVQETDTSAPTPEEVAANEDPTVKGTGYTAEDLFFSSES